MMTRLDPEVVKDNGMREIIEKWSTNDYSGPYADLVADFKKNLDTSNFGSSDWANAYADFYHNYKEPRDTDIAWLVAGERIDKDSLKELGYNWDDINEKYETIVNENLDIDSASLSNKCNEIINAMKGTYPESALLKSIEETTAAAEETTAAAEETTAAAEETTMADNSTPPPLGDTGEYEDYGDEVIADEDSDVTDDTSTISSDAHANLRLALQHMFDENNSLKSPYTDIIDGFMEADPEKYSKDNLVNDKDVLDEFINKYSADYDELRLQRDTDMAWQIAAGYVAKDDLVNKYGYDANRLDKASEIVNSEIKGDRDYDPNNSYTAMSVAWDRCKDIYSRLIDANSKKTLGDFADLGYSEKFLGRQMSVPASESTTVVSGMPASAISASASVSESTTAIPESTTAASESTVSIPESTTAVSESTTVVSGMPASDISASAAAPESTAAIPESTTAASESTTAIPESTVPTEHMGTPDPYANIKAKFNTPEYWTARKQINRDMANAINSGKYNLNGMSRFDFLKAKGYDYKLTNGCGVQDVLNEMYCIPKSSKGIIPAVDPIPTSSVSSYESNPYGNGGGKTVAAVNTESVTDAVTSVSGSETESVTDAVTSVSGSETESVTDAGSKIDWGYVPGETSADDGLDLSCMD